MHSEDDGDGNRPSAGDDPGSNAELEADGDGDGTVVNFFGQIIYLFPKRSC